jgi:DNA-binding response OmpR family regulator
MKKVFYVEKEKFLRNMMEQGLPGLGLDCYAVDGLEDFVYLINDLSPGLLILDWETCKLLSELDIDTQIPVLLTFCGDSGGSEKKVMNLPISGYLEKPISPLDIARFVDTLPIT